MNQEKSKLFQKPHLRLYTFFLTMHIMESTLIFPLLLLIFLTIINFSSSQNRCANPSTVRAGFWFSNYNRYSSFENITSSLYTHLFYYALYVDKASFRIEPPPQNQLRTLADFTSSVKSKNPSVKTLLSVSTDHHDLESSNGALSTMTSDRALRSTFIDSTIELATEFGFNGLDLAWQFPNSPSDMANLAVLLSEWRESIDNAASPLLLTATVYFSNHVFDGTTDNVDYPIASMFKNLDWVNVLSFGFHKTSGVLHTAADAPLYDKTTDFSCSYGIRSWLDAGVESCKIVMGIPLYGRSWFLKNKEKNGLGAQAVAAGPRLKLSNRTGLIAYSEIEGILKDDNTIVSYDIRTVSSYFHSGGLWVSFDSVEVVDEKIKFGLRNDLLGYFLWPISFDDLNNTISKHTANAWQMYNASGVGKIGYKGASSPEEMNAKDFAPNHLIDVSRTMKHNPQIILCCCVSVFLFINLVRI